MVSESSKETVSEFYLTGFFPINAIRDLYFLKKWHGCTFKYQAN